MSKAIFVDTSVCIGCRGCQVACKQWNNLPAEATTNRGTYQNPEDLSAVTFKLVRMKEVEIDGELKWLFFPDGCRHCVDPPCLGAADNRSAIFKDDFTGAVIYTANTRQLNAETIQMICPYNIPRRAKSGGLAKCDMCYDRIINGQEPTCVKTCPTGAMNFGDRKDMLALADKRLQTLKRRYPKAALLNKEDVSVLFLVAYDPMMYHDTAVACGRRGITRQMALRKMTAPFRRFAAQLG